VVIVGRLQARRQASLVAISGLRHDLSSGRRLGSVDVRQSLNCLLILAERLFSDVVLSERLHEFRARGQLLLHVFQIDTGFVQLLAQSLFEVCVSPSPAASAASIITLGIQGDESAPLQQ
jgi:hypothetical protein